MEQGLAALGIEDIEAAAREAAREAAAAAAATAGAASAGGGDAGGGSNVDTLTAEQIDALLMRHDQVSLPKFCLPLCLFLTNHVFLRFGLFS